MDYNTAVTSYQKWIMAGFMGGIGLGTYALLCMYSPMGLMAAGGTIMGAAFFAGGHNQLQTGIWQVMFNRKNEVLPLKDIIKAASNHYDLPAVLVATVLAAELIDYNVYDYLGDDFTLYKAESHSMGIAQFRIDNMRKWNINGWDHTTPASEIRSCLLDPAESVWILAQVLKYFYDSAPQATKNVCQLDMWNSWNYNNPIDRTYMEGTVTLFAGAKDKGHLNATGELAGASRAALKFVIESGVFQ